MPKASSKQPMDDIEIIEEEEETEIEEASLQRVTNLLEAAKHVCMLNQALENMNARIQSGKIKDVMKDMMECFKDIISKIIPQVGEANIHHNHPFHKWPNVLGLETKDGRSRRNVGGCYATQVHL